MLRYTDKYISLCFNNLSRVSKDTLYIALLTSKPLYHKFIAFIIVRALHSLDKFHYLIYIKILYKVRVDAKVLCC